MNSRHAATMAWGGALLACCAVLFSLARPSLAETASPPAAGRGAGDIATVELEVKGMSCDACAKTIKSELEAMDGVVKADVSFERKNAVVQYHSSKLEPERLVRKIREIGYRAKLVKQL